MLSTVITSIKKTKDKVASTAKSITQSSNKVGPEKGQASAAGEADTSTPSSTAGTPTPSNASSQPNSRVGSLKKQGSLKATATVAEVVASSSKRKEEARRNSDSSSANGKSKACSLQ